MKTGTIYFLTDNNSGIPKYVGQTLNLRNRRNKHIFTSKTGSNLKDQWVDSVLKQGNLLEAVELEKVPVNEMDFWEQHYISLFRSWGFDLLNQTSGGVKDKRLSPELRSRISESLKGKIQSAETLRKRSETSKATWASHELRELKRRQTKHLIDTGVLKTRKGMPSPNKGKPFCGNKEKLSESLKEHYKTNSVWNKNILSASQVGSILKDYETNKNVKFLSLKYSLNRKIIYKVLSDNNINHADRDKGN